MLHYFHDINKFMRIMCLLKDSGKMICNDFTPFTKVSNILNLEQPTMSYFSTEAFEGEMAYVRFFDERSEVKCLNAVTENILSAR